MAEKLVWKAVEKRRLPRLDLIAKHGYCSSPCPLASPLGRNSDVPMCSEMAYSDPQRARDQVRAWRKANPERHAEIVKRQNRNALIRRAIKERRLPRLDSIAKHGLSDEDVQSIVKAVMASRGDTVAARVGMALVNPN